jgi:hypothetical protein
MVLYCENVQMVYTTVDILFIVNTKFLTSASDNVVNFVQCLSVPCLEDIS